MCGSVVNFETCVFRIVQHLQVAGRSASNCAVGLCFCQGAFLKCTTLTGGRHTPLSNVMECCCFRKELLCAPAAIFLKIMVLHVRFAFCELEAEVAFAISEVVSETKKSWCGQRCHDTPMTHHPEVFSRNTTAPQGPPPESWVSIRRPYVEICDPHRRQARCALTSP